MARFHLALLILASAPTVVLSQLPKVKIDVYFETGCPFCLKFLTETLPPIMNTPGMVGLVDFVGHPFGNAYYATPECGGAPYNMNIRLCWEKLCGRPKMGFQSPTCYRGELVCQHGEFECKLNRAASCMKQLLPTDPLKYFAFDTCLAKGAVQAGATGTEAQLAATCGAQTGAPWIPDGQNCWTGVAVNGIIAGDGAILAQQEASMTPVHKVVPYVELNGVAIDDNNNLLHDICVASQIPPVVNAPGQGFVYTAAAVQVCASVPLKPMPVLLL